MTVTLDKPDTTERRLKKAKVSIMRSTLPGLRLWAGVLMIGKTELRDDIPTACTNGRDEMYGRAFIDGLKDKEIAFVVLHEAMHKALRHLTVWRGLYKQDPRLANASCDHVINLMIVEADPQEAVVAVPRLPDGRPLALLDQKYKGMNAKQVFDLLKQEQEEGGGGGEPLDEHDWEGAEDLSDEDKEALEREVDRALRQGAMEAKKMGGAGNISRELGDLLDPQIDWREVLREFVTSVCTNKDTSSWRRVNRRFIGEGVYLPSLVGESVGKIVVGIDTSGSIGGAELASFMSEVVGICNTVTPDCVDLLYWDAKVAGHEQYRPGEYAGMEKVTRVRGGGGTDPRCVKDYMEENKIEAECIIMLTDGHVPSWGENWPAPILWVVSRNPDETATCGKTVHIK
jgi:predicted metal-dependent peptidase